MRPSPPVMAMVQISTRLGLALGGEVWAGESHLHQEDALCGRVPCREGALCMRKLLHGDALWEEPAIQGPHCVLVSPPALHFREQSFLKFKEKLLENDYKGWPACPVILQGPGPRTLHSLEHTHSHQKSPQWHTGSFGSIGGGREAHGVLGRAVTLSHTSRMAEWQ